MKKIYIGASQMMGKSVLWSLLDGHSKVHVNLTHITTGLFLINKDAIDYINNKNKSVLKKVEDKLLNTLKINYPNKSQIELNIGDFFYLMYRYGGYAGLYCWAKNNVIQINNFELGGEFTKSHFDINCFESLIAKNFFNKNKTILELDEVINIMQQNFLLSKVINHNKKTEFFIESLASNIINIKETYINIKDAKFIILKRNLLSLCYSNLIRSSENMYLNKNSFVKKFFFNLLEKTSLTKLFYFASQEDYFKKINSYNTEIMKYQNDKRVLIIDFNDLILRTEDSMRKISNFVGISYEEILSLPTVENKKVIKSKPIIGKINNDYLSDFSQKEIDMVKNIYSKIKKKSYFYYKFFLYLNFSFLILKSLLIKK